MKIKYDIINFISGIDDENELNKIYSYILREEIEKKLYHYYDLKKLNDIKNTEIHHYIQNSIVYSGNSINDIIFFLDNLIKNEGIFDGKTIMEKNNGILDSELLFSSPVYKNIKRKIINIQGNIIGSASMGAGEFFMILFGKGISPAKISDLIIYDKVVELKTSRKTAKGSKTGGRMRSTTGFNSPAGVWQYVREYLEKVCGIENAEEIKNDINISGKGIDKLNEYLSNVERNKVVGLVELIFRKFFINIDSLMNDAEIRRYAETSVIGNKIDLKRFINNYIEMNFLYYKKIEGFDILMLFNSDNFKYLCFEDLDDIRKNRNEFKIIPSITWSSSESRSSSPIITLF